MRKVGQKIYGYSMFVGFNTVNELMPKIARQIT